MQDTTNTTPAEQPAKTPDSAPIPIITEKQARVVVSVLHYVMCQHEWKTVKEVTDAYNKKGLYCTLSENDVFAILTGCESMINTRRTIVDFFVKKR